MPLRAVRPRHVYLAAAVAFVLIGGFEAARMAAGDDPALTARAQPTPAATDPARGADPYRAGRGDPYGAPPDGGFDPGASGGSLPEPQTRQS